MSSPLIVLIELIVGLIVRASESVGFIFLKFIEFFISLKTITGIIGVFVVAIVGGIVITLVLKIFFKTSKSLIFYWLILFFIGLVLLAILLFSAY